MTQFQKLQQVVENPKAYGLAKNSNAYKSIKRLSECGKSYTAQSGYSQGWATKSDWTSTVEDVLKNYISLTTYATIAREVERTASTSL